MKLDSPQFVLDSCSDCSIGWGFPDVGNSDFDCSEDSGFRVAGNSHSDCSKD